MSNKESAYAAASDVDIVVPGSPQRILQILKNYPHSWARAGNAPYFIPGRHWSAGGHGSREWDGLQGPY